MPPKTGPAKAHTAPATEPAQDEVVPTPETEPAKPAAKAAAVKAAAVKAAEKILEDAEPEAIEPPEEVKLPGKHDRESAAALYPDDAQLWCGEINGLVFAFPRIDTVKPPRQWLRLVYQLQEHAQTFEWMNIAGVPAELQNQTDLLSDEQYYALFRAWFIDGEITLPK